MRAAAASLQLVCLCSALALAACGGGGDGGGATPPATTQSDLQNSTTTGFKAADLNGTWFACTETSNATSLQEEYTFTADSATLVSYEYVRSAYPSTDCTGNVAGYLERAGKVQLDGATQQVDNVTAQKVVFAPEDISMSNMSFSGSPTATYKQLLVITSSGILQEGDTAQLGTDGYPTALSSLQYAKAP